MQQVKTQRPQVAESPEQSSTRVVPAENPQSLPTVGDVVNPEGNRSPDEPAFSGAPVVEFTPYVAPTETASSGECPVKVAEGYHSCTWGSNDMGRRALLASGAKFIPPGAVDQEGRKIVLNEEICSVGRVPGIAPDGSPGPALMYLNDYVGVMTRERYEDICRADLEKALRHAPKAIEPRRETQYLSGPHRNPPGADAIPLDDSGVMVSTGAVEIRPAN